MFINGIWRNLFKDTYFTTLPAKKFFFEKYQFCVAANITFLERGVCNEIKRSLDGSKTMTYDDDKIEFSFFAYVSTNFSVIVIHLTFIEVTGTYFVTMFNTNRIAIRFFLTLYCANPPLDGAGFLEGFS